MTQTTMTEAVKRSGVSRPTFKNRYVKTGLIKVIETNGKQYVKTAELNKALAKPQKKAPTKRVTKPKPKTSLKPPTKLTETDKLKLQLKKLRAELKISKTDNELHQKQIESLNRKNANLNRRLSPSLAKAKTTVKPKQLQAKPIALSTPKPRVRKGSSENEHWVDKWWDSF